ncbi:MAG TPA: hypothetical protein VIC85_11050 [Ktedonobacterales bacterium]
MAVSATQPLARAVSSASAVPAASGALAARGGGILAAPVLVPAIGILGYVAFLLAGFGTGMGAWRPVPLYLFFGVLLFLLQIGLVERRTASHLAYTAGASIFALLFAGDVLLNRSPIGHFTRNPWTYMLINGLLLAVFLYDVARRGRLSGDGQTTSSGMARPGAPFFSARGLATTFAGLALLSYLASVLVDLLGAGATPYVVVDLGHALGPHLPGRVRYLQDLDLAIALFATAAALLFLGIVAAVAASPTRGQRGGVTGSVESFQSVLGRVLGTAMGQAAFSARLVLGPLIWVGAGLSVTYLAVRTTQYFESAQASSNVVDLFNPFSPTSVARFGQGLLTIALSAMAVATVVVSIAVVEHQVRIVSRTLRIIRAAGQATALSLAFFIFSLAFLNAVANFLGITRLEPFQVGAFALLALAAASVLPLYAAIRRHAA